MTYVIAPEAQIGECDPTRKRERIIDFQALGL